MSLKLVGEVALDGSGFEKGLGALGKSAEQFGTTLKSTLGGVFAVGAFEEMIRGAMESADKIERLSKVYGLSMKTLQQWSYAANLNDTSLDSLTKSYKKFASAKLDAQRDPGGGMAQNFKEVGIELERLNKESPESIMYDIAAGMQTAAEDSDNFASALKILGKSADEVLPALKALAEGVGKEAPVVSDSNIKAMAAEMENFKKFGAAKGPVSGAISGWLSYKHFEFAQLVEDLWLLAKVPVNRLFDKSRTWATQREDEAQEIRPRVAFMAGLRNPNGPMVFSTKDSPGAVLDKSAGATLSNDEMLEAAMKLRQAGELSERTREASLTTEERITELLMQQEQIARRIKETPYGPEYAGLKLQEAKNEAELQPLFKRRTSEEAADVRIEERDQKNQERSIKQGKVRERSENTGDSLSRVGNFLGSGASVIEGIATRQLDYLKEIAENTRPSGGNGDTTSYPPI